MNIEKEIKFEGDSKDLIWRHPSDIFALGHEIKVNESQEVVFSKNNEALDAFRQGTHELSIKLFPIMKKTLPEKVEKNMIFTATAWFINIKIFNRKRWGTLKDFEVIEPKYGTMVPIKAFGEYTITVNDSRKFIQNFVLKYHTYDTSTVEKKIQEIIIQKTQKSIEETLNAGTIDLLNLLNENEEISKLVKQNLIYDFNELGIEFNNFSLESITIANENKTILRLENNLKDKELIDNIRFNYVKEYLKNIIEEYN
ncbi:MAG: SPFH domain-containing protein [Spirochaetia bacterium]|nr:SPFH domain-containing protein [Spirochaetia bacterium]